MVLVRNRFRVKTPDVVEGLWGLLGGGGGERKRRKKKEGPRKPFLNIFQAKPPLGCLLGLSVYTFDSDLFRLWTGRCVGHSPCHPRELRTRSREY